MIRRGELSEIGYISKTHGVSGEMRLVIPVDVDIEELSCVILDIDGIFVPFFLHGVRSTGTDGYLVVMDGIDSEDEACELVGKTVYALNRELVIEEDVDRLYAEDLIGYRVVSVEGDLVGDVVDIDTSTENTLLVVSAGDGKRVLIPLADELVSELNIEQKFLKMDLPEGLLNL